MQMQVAQRTAERRLYYHWNSVLPLRAAPIWQKSPAVCVTLVNVKF